MATIGSNAWSAPTNVQTSNDSRASVAARGISNYLVASGFGFSISSPANITGLQLDVERSTSATSNVALLGSWTVGTSRSIPAGVDRCLIVVASVENGVAPMRNVTALTYGGRSLTPISELGVGGGTVFSARLEVWILLEAEIALASGTNLVATYDHATLAEYCEAFSSAVYQNVDQLDPVLTSQATGAFTSTDPHQLGASISTIVGSMAVNAVVCGNAPTTVPPVGPANAYTINSGYTERTDHYFANAGWLTSGGALQVADKVISSNGSEQPTCTFAGSVNRWVMIGLVLQRPRERDHAVRMMKGGVIGTADRANSSHGLPRIPT